MGYLRETRAPGRAYGTVRHRTHEAEAEASVNDRQGLRPAGRSLYGTLVPSAAWSLLAVGT